MTRNAILTIFMIPMLLVGGLAAGCSKKKQQLVAEEPVKPLPAEGPIEATAKDPKPAAPTPADLRAIVARIFQTAVTVDAEKPYDYMVGDFNGDISQDIAIVVKPVEAGLSEINSEVANWILEDPSHIPQPDPKKVVQPHPAAPAPVVVQKGDSLLAIIHGFGPEGWRSPNARQTYLLKGAVGMGLTVIPAKDLARAAKGKDPQPRLEAKLIANGDVFKEVLGKKEGYIYFTGAKYVWYP